MRRLHFQFLFLLTGAEQEVQNEFQKHDPENTGVLTTQQLMSIIAELCGEFLPVDEIAEIVGMFSRGSVYKQSNSFVWGKTTLLGILAQRIEKLDKKKACTTVFPLESFHLAPNILPPYLAAFNENKQCYFYCYQDPLPDDICSFFFFLASKGFTLHSQGSQWERIAVIKISQNIAHFMHNDGHSHLSFQNK